MALTAALELADRSEPVSAPGERGGPHAYAGLVVDLRRRGRAFVGHASDHGQTRQDLDHREPLEEPVGDEQRLIADLGAAGHGARAAGGARAEVDPRPGDGNEELSVDGNAALAR